MHATQPISFTMDLEGYGLRGMAAPPIERAVATILSATDGRRGTIFVVGELARERPELVRMCVEGGHEIALHGHRHVPIDELGERGFRDDLRRGRAAVEDVAGHSVIGYRAPLFSLTRMTPWAPAALAEEGFVYSSSVLPARSPIRGLPGAPHGPFRWRNGIVELPCPVGGTSHWLLPYLGGVYLRYLPIRLVRRWARLAHPREALWLYCHPYDADRTGRRLDLPHAGAATTTILGLRRRRTPERIRAVLELGPSGGPLGDIAARLTALPEFSLD
jgi:polysaccharide deacetylase family protein (PEP-CTERM system associated)